MAESSHENQQIKGAGELPGVFLESTSPAAAARFTALMEQQRGFSFLRLGDGELRFLLEAQENVELTERRGLRPSCEIAYGSPAVTRKDYDRLLKSYERCSVIDLHRDLPYNRAHLARLRWRRAPEAIGTASSGAVGLLFTWLHHEFRSYLTRHRVVICGAEASLLRELLTDPEYRRIAASYWPEGANVTFVQPRRDGRNVSEDLDAIKDDLTEAIRDHRADTVFVSLGGGAKILCYELAAELGVCAIDCGSALRALTYSGSDGQSLWRASHHPFLFRVPLDVYLPALQRAYPGIDPMTLIAKAHAQLCLDLQRKVLLQSVTSDANDGAMFDPSSENLRTFAESFAWYRRSVLPIARINPEAAVLVSEFAHWRRKHGLGWDGRLFRMGLAVKALGRRIWPTAQPSPATHSQ